MARNRLLATALALGLASLTTACPSSSPQTGSTTPGGLVTGEGADPVAGGEPTGDVVFPEEDFRAEQPAAGTPRDFQLPEVNQFRLGDALDVYLVEKHDLPTVYAELEFEGGDRLDPKGKEGLAGICVGMLSEGTRELDKLAYQEALADLASEVSSYSGPESHRVYLQTLTKNFGPTFELFAATVTEPGFRKAELDRLIARSVEALQQRKASAQSVRARLADNLLYGPRHPFGKVYTEKSLRSIKVSDCKRLHRSYVKPKGARLFVVGDMTEAEVREKFAPLLARWKGAPRKLARLPKPASRKGKVFFVNIPGSAQSSIMLQHFGPSRTASDYFANELMARILGGGFSSRINMNLREDKGYSYGSYGGFDYNRHYGKFWSAGSVRSDATHQSLHEMLSEIHNLAGNTRPPTEDELAREKNGAILGLPASFATARQTLNMYRMLVYYGLPLEYWNGYVEQVSSVAPEQVVASAKEHLEPQRASIFVVGDATAPQIVRDDSGEDVPMTDAEGKPVTLLDALAQLAEDQGGGKGSLVILDPDGKVLETR